MTQPRPLRILFFLPAINYDRIFECFVRELLERGHTVRVLLDGSKQKLPVGAGEIARGFATEFGDRYSWQPLVRRDRPRDGVARTLRLAVDYARYLEPEYAAADALRERSRERVRPVLRSVIDRAARTARGRQLVARVLRALERALPAPPDLVARIREEGPDVVMAAPLVSLGSAQADAFRAAEQLGIPTVLPVASWDNLTNKGLVRDVPTRTIVWNDDQVEEAVRLHGLPRDRVHAVGAHAWDHWFAWRPSSSREEFAATVGLDPARPFFLYACSSSFIGGDETVFVLDWLDRLRAADGALATAGVLVRPHPQHTRIWQDVDLSGRGAVVWPLAGEVPTDARRKDNYYDSIFHSAGVVGINTSALIEAAIVGRPVLTITTDRYRASQSGTLHFGYVAGDDGVLDVASSWDEHLAQLAAALTDGSRRERIEPFLRRFVRPHGLDRRAAPLAAEVVEQAATERSSPPAASAPARAVVAVLVGATALRAALLRRR